MAFQHQLLVHNDFVHAVGGVRVLGTISAQTGYAPRRLRTVDHFGLVLVRSGHGYYRDGNGFKATLDPGNVVLIFPGLAHTYGADSSHSWEETYCVFEGEIFLPFFAAGRLSASSPVLVAARHIPQLLTQIGESTCQAQQTGLLVSVLSELLLTHSGADQKAWVKLAKSILAADSALGAPLADIAARLSMSEQMFRKRFSAEVGIPPIRYRMISRLESAKRLLAGTRLTNRAIAMTLGFADEFHFSKAFANYVGVNPSAFRRGIRSETSVEPVERP